MLKKVLLVLVVVVCSVEGAPTERDDSHPVCPEIPYNGTYPLTDPVVVGDEIKHRIAIITDKDKLSKATDVDFLWRSKLKKGWLVSEDSTQHPGSVKVKRIDWDADELTIESDLNVKGRAMEMSELKVFNGKLYTCDDRTGIVYELVEGQAKPVPFVLLNDGDGHETKVFKCEWMTVKDELLYVGSVGMEWLKPDGSILHKDTFWVKTVDSRGLVTNYNWFDHYDAMRRSVDFPFPGYFFTEAVNWSEQKKKWFFLPRKGSNLTHDEKLDGERCVNKLFSTDNDFTTFENVDVGVLNTTRGFSSFKFIPGTDDNAFLALKTVEFGEAVETYIGAYDIEGNILFDLEFLGNVKYEGLEFI